jgi:hypothetical protein
MRAGLKRPEFRRGLPCSAMLLDYLGLLVVRVGSVIVNPWGMIVELASAQVRRAGPFCMGSRHRQSHNGYDQACQCDLKY